MGKQNRSQNTAHKKVPHGISERSLMLLIGLLLVLGIGLMLYYYHAANAGTLAPSPTPAPPTATPILDENGDPALIHAWFPALSGESFFAMGAGGETLLVDAGTKSDADTLNDFLREKNTVQLDAVFLSSPEEKHMGGMAEIVKAFPIGCFYLTPECAADKRCKELLDLLQSRDIPVQQVHASFVSTVEWAENAELRILSPHDVSYDSSADESLMLRLAYGSSEILLCGNAGELAERMAVKALPNELLHADVLKLANGGAASGTSERLVGAVKPKAAVICGSERALAAPVLERLTRYGTAVFSTAEHGTIEIILDGAVAKMVK